MIIITDFLFAYHDGDDSVDDGDDDDYHDEDHKQN